MTNQEKKTALNAYRCAVREAERLQREMQRWRSLAEKVTPDVHRAPARGGGEGRRLETAVEAISELEDRLEKKLTQSVRLRLAVDTAITSVRDSRLREVLILRYVEGLTLFQIAALTGYSYRQTKRLHEAAIEKMAPNVPFFCDII